MTSQAKRNKAFTLIELLVVISIITILMSILLPAIKKTRTVAGQGMCAKHLHTINQAFQSYCNEYMEHIPLTANVANSRSWWSRSGHRPEHIGPIGLGCIWEADLVDDPETFFCPGRDRDSGFSDHQFAGYAGYEMSGEAFARQMRNNQRSLTGYAIGYCSAPAYLAGSTGYNQYPPEIVAPDDVLENLRERYVCWIADARGTRGPILSSQYTTHGNYKFVNFGNVDGSTRSVIDIYPNQPSDLEMEQANVFVDWDAPCRDRYWFENGQPTWQFWYWFGPGAGF